MTVQRVIYTHNNPLTTNWQIGRLRSQNFAQKLNHIKRRIQKIIPEIIQYFI